MFYNSTTERSTGVPQIQVTAEQSTLALQAGIAQTVEQMQAVLDRRRAVFVAVVGGAVSGKTTHISPALAENFPGTVVISEDDYCIGTVQSAMRHGAPNLHVPEDYNPGRIQADLAHLRRGKPTHVPRYDFEHRQPTTDTKLIEPNGVIVMEGAYLLQPHLRQLFDIGVFVETNDHDRFVRRLLRPRRNPAQSDGRRLREYTELSYPSHYREIAPTQSAADIIIVNPYTPAEAAGKLALLGAAPSVPEEASVTHYRHPAMQTSEACTLTIDKAGLQNLRYLPNTVLPGVQLNFCVPSDEYIVDLSLVGYTSCNPS